MSRRSSPLHAGLLRALEPTPHPVGDTLSDGSVVHAEDDATDDGGAHLRLVREPATEQGRPACWSLRSGVRRGFVDDVLIAHQDFDTLYEMVRANAGRAVIRDAVFASVYPAQTAPRPVGRTGVRVGGRSGGRSGWRWEQAEEMLRRLIVASYDATDPEEAAEQMLVALGAAPRRMPVSLTSDPISDPISDPREPDTAARPR